MRCAIADGVGIRMALGAGSGALKKMFVQSSLLLTAVGVAIGLGAAAGVTRLMKSLLFGVTALDPITYRTGTTLTIINSTLSTNSAAVFGGGINNSAGGIVTISNSIVANSPSGGNCINASTFTANGSNLATDGTCPGFTQVTSAQLNLGPLFDNGGPTQTHALFPGSAAIDTGDQTRCAADGITRDQRGFRRDAHCDVGSFEFGGQVLADLRLSIGIIPNAVKDPKNLTYLITVVNDGPDQAENVVITDVVPLGTVFLGASARKASGAPGSCTTPSVGSGGVVRCNVGVLDPTQSGAATVLVNVTVRGNEAIVNTARVDSGSSDPAPANNVASIQTKASGGK